jgi:hypothetical protein
VRRRSDVRHFVGIREREQPLPSAADASPEELERMGPRFLLEINTVTAEQSLVIGGSDKAVIDAWLSALARAVAHVAATNAETEEEPHGMPALLSENILRLELTGIVALGYTEKARDGMLKERKNGWASRFLVLTETTLFYYKRPAKGAASDEDLPLFSFGATLRSGEFIFGQERGRMPLANASVTCERASEEGVQYTCATRSNLRSARCRVCAPIEAR